MEEMEREKFDKKLQMFYLSQKNVRARTILSNEGTDTLTSLIKEHCADILALREVNDSARRRISDLESELSELKAKKDAETSVFKTVRSSNIYSSKSSGSGSHLTSDMHIEENRKRERHAALAIAEHDSLLINQLEAEGEALRSQHECDLTLVKDATGTITRLLKDIKEKDIVILKHTEHASLLETHLMLLADHIRSAQSLIQNSMQDHRILLDYDLTPCRGMVEIREEYLKRQDVRYLTNVINSDEPKNQQLHSSSKMKNVFPLLTKIDTQDFKDPIHQCQRDSNDIIENNLRTENAKLFEMLQKERELSKWQEITMNEIQASAEEVTLLEAAEIVRLELELEICHVEKDEWEKRCNLALLNVEYGVKRSIELCPLAPS